MFTTALASVEGQLARNKNVKVKLSEQEVIECARNPWTGVLLGCNGGWHFSVYTHAADYTGVTTQTIKPYKGNTNTACSPASVRVAQATVKSYVDITSGDEEQMRIALEDKGPLYVTLYVSSDFFSYKSGIYTDKYGYCTSSVANNHGVLLVGYGTENSVDYWLVKNSWGKIKFDLSGQNSLY